MTEADTVRRLDLRPATPADIPELRSLAERIWRGSYATMLAPAQIDYMLEWMYAAGMIEAEMARGVAWHLALDRGSPVGYLAITQHDATTAELNKLYLLPGLQGAGHGQDLLDRALAIAAARGCTAMRLRVNKTNARALKAYDRAGFTSCPQRWREACIASTWRRQIRSKSYQDARRSSN